MDGEGFNLNEALRVYLNDPQNVVCNEADFADDDVEEELHDAFNESYRSCKALVRCLRKTSRASDSGRESSKCNESNDEHNPYGSYRVRRSVKLQVLCAYLCGESSFTKQKCCFVGYL